MDVQVCRMAVDTSGFSDLYNIKATQYGGTWESCGNKINN